MTSEPVELESAHQSESQLEDLNPAQLKRPKLDTEGKARGQRMFGMLLGTLNKNKQSMTSKSDAEVRRSDIEKKLHQKLQAERIQLSLKQSEETQVKQKRALELRNIEDLKRAGECVGMWKKNVHQSNQFISTLAVPSILYIPAKHNDMTQKIFDERVLHSVLDTEEAAVYDRFGGLPAPSTDTIAINANVPDNIEHNTAINDTDMIAEKEVSAPITTDAVMEEATPIQPTTNQPTTSTLNFTPNTTAAPKSPFKQATTVSKKEIKAVIDTVNTVPSPMLPIQVAPITIEVIAAPVIQDKEDFEMTLVHVDVPVKKAQGIKKTPAHTPRTSARSVIAPVAKEIVPAATIEESLTTSTINETVVSPSQIPVPIQSADSAFSVPEIKVADASEIAITAELPLPSIDLSNANETVAVLTKKEIAAAKKLAKETPVKKTVSPTETPAKKIKTPTETPLKKSKSSASIEKEVKETPAAKKRAAAALEKEKNAPTPRTSMRSRGATPSVTPAETPVKRKPVSNTGTAKKGKAVVAVEEEEDQGNILNNTTEKEGDWVVVGAGLEEDVTLSNTPDKK